MAFRTKIRELYDGKTTSREIAALTGFSRKYIQFVQRSENLPRVKPGFSEKFHFKKDKTMTKDEMRTLFPGGKLYEDLEKENAELKELVKAMGEVVIEVYSDSLFYDYSKYDAPKQVKLVREIKKTELYKKYLNTEVKT